MITRLGRCYHDYDDDNETTAAAAAAATAAATAAAPAYDDYSEGIVQVVSASRAKEFAIPEDMSHIEVSSVSGHNINVAFYMLAAEVLRYRKLGTIHRLAMLDYPLGYSDLDVHEDPSENAELCDDGPQYTHLFKILLLGAPRTGKTSLRYRFCRNHFSPEYHATSGIEYTTRTVLVDGERVKVQIWDVSGDDIYSHIRKSYYKGANGFIIVYDATNMQTFVKAEHLLKELSMYGQSDTPKIVVGNKCDLTRRRCVDSSTAREWASGWRVPIIETSASSGDNVGAPFLKLTIALKRHLAPWKRVYNFS
ncbi:Ras-related protein Rab-1A [Lamellibrachia satsuma]|nr:Ras-related protein Rab-1A [Lamellibrachia satsuma]